MGALETHTATVPETRILRLTGGHKAARKFDLFFYLNGESSHSQDSHKVYTPSGQFTHTRDLAWNHPHEYFMSPAGNEEMTSVQGNLEPPPPPQSIERQIVNDLRGSWSEDERQFR